MSNDLSKQLAELCGIEGKEGQPECLSTDTPVCKKGFTACCPENCTGCKYFNRFEKVYPDFTKPENFVRLFDLPIVNNGTRTVGYFVVYEFTMKTIKDFIKCLIIKLERTQFSITKEVKQSIREAEWVYE